MSEWAVRNSRNGWIFSWNKVYFLCSNMGPSGYTVAEDT